MSTPERSVILAALQYCEDNQIDLCQTHPYIVDPKVALTSSAVYDRARQAVTVIVPDWLAKLGINSEKDLDRYIID